jgi:hypothetical protein
MAITLMSDYASANPTYTIPRHKISLFSTGGTLSMLTPPQPPSEAG